MNLLSGAREWSSRPLLIALIGTLAAFACQVLTVRYNYGGNWTGLFCAGDRYPDPPSALAAENIYRFRNSFGYDGQSYHTIAHDPFVRRGFQTAIDAPRFRYRRILVPLVAWTLAGGKDRYIDLAYYATTLAVVFLGAWWTAMVVRYHGVHPAWALLYFFTAAVIGALDRMLVDAALLAAIAGMIFYAGRQKWAMVFVLSAAAGLSRESGLLVVGALCAWLVFEKRYKLAVIMEFAALPALAWYRYLSARTPPVPDSFLSLVPFSGYVHRIFTPARYNDIPIVNIASTLADYAALLSLGWAVVYAAIHVREWIRTLHGWIGFASIALLAVVSTPAVWVDPYGYTRGFSPLLYVVAIDALRTRSSIATAPLMLMAPRIGLLVIGQVPGILRGVGGL